MPRSRTRAGRKAQATHRNFLRNVEDFGKAMAQKEWKHSVESTENLLIERTAKADGAKEIVSFSKAYSELSVWSKQTFKDVFDEDDSELGFSDLLTDAFLAGKTVKTTKAEYRITEGR